MKYIRWPFDIIKNEIFFPYILMKEGEPIPPMDESGDGDTLFDTAAPEQFRAHRSDGNSRET
jgi:hypothetical protein